MSNKNKNLADKKINEVLKKIDFNKLEGKSKLLIIQCSESKISRRECHENKYFETDFYEYLNTARNLRKFHYLEYINSNPNYFQVVRDFDENGLRTNVDGNYFIDCLNGTNYIPAFERYNGIFYSYELKNLYSQKNSETNLHILIISGLYGILEFRDGIVDYHFEMKKGPKIWGNCLTNTINQYIQENEIDHNAVFYCLSNDYVKNITPNVRWKNIWIKNGGSGSLTTSAKFLRDYFLPRL
jgi:hypothetical protein